MHCYHGCSKFSQSESLGQYKQKGKKENNNLYASQEDKEQCAVKNSQLCDMGMTISAVLIRLSRHDCQQIIIS
jgi:hypothetical protein